jgi:hypothetical protein
MEGPCWRGSAPADDRAGQAKRNAAMKGTKDFNRRQERTVRSSFLQGDGTLLLEEIAVERGHRRTKLTYADYLKLERVFA